MQRTMALTTTGYNRDYLDDDCMGRGFVPHLFKAKGCMVLHAQRETQDLSNIDELPELDWR